MKPIITHLDVRAMPVEGDGLFSGVMRKLPGIVAITGPNGAGKSRLLKRVVMAVEFFKTGVTRDEAIKTVEQQAWENQQRAGLVHPELAPHDNNKRAQHNDFLSQANTFKTQAAWLKSI